MIDRTLASARPDVTDMVLVHRVFRREFALAPRLVRECQPGDTARAAELTIHIEAMLRGLHHHHHVEDKLLWPKLRQRVRVDGLVIDRMTEQHHRIAAAITDIAGPLAAWRIGAGLARRAELAYRLDELAIVLTEHLDDEEEFILPLAAEFLTVAEWAELGRSGMAGQPLSRVLMATGRILEDASPSEQATFLGRLPLLVRLAWYAAGARRYRRATARLRQGPAQGAGAR
ncbi:hemerythrin domain-containing protein [Longispora albida]|uniref:hemerythrin domain-containing protein n=1 Tax=Longispora albida TaxID=203523 RepID=UPI00037226F6|nr:hemerythrin domain-containing protein [Longispora albida]